jgi:hypothetical protein
VDGFHACQIMNLMAARCACGYEHRARLQLPRGWKQPPLADGH